MKVAIQRLKNVPLPSYATAGSAGMDLTAAIEEPIFIQPGERVKVPTGIALAVPLGYEAQLRPRSGLALKHGISLINSPATIDSDYRGEIVLVLINHGAEVFAVTPGMRVAQMLIMPYPQIEWDEVDGLDDTQRGVKGFGSSGC